MNFRHVVSVRQHGVGSKSGKAYDFTIAQGVIETAKGPQMCEVMLEKEHPPLKSGGLYRIDVELYPDREKRLTMRVVGLVSVQESKAA